MKNKTTVGKDLREYIQRLDKLEKKKRALQEEMKDILVQMNNKGFDTKIVKILLIEQKWKDQLHDNQKRLLKTYRRALESTNKMT